MHCHTSNKICNRNPESIQYHKPAIMRIRCAKCSMVVPQSNVDGAQSVLGLGLSILTISCYLLKGFKSLKMLKTQLALTLISLAICRQVILTLSWMRLKNKRWCYSMKGAFRRSYMLWPEVLWSTACQEVVHGIKRIQNQVEHLWSNVSNLHPRISRETRTTEESSPSWLCIFISWSPSGHFGPGGLKGRSSVGLDHATVSVVGFHATWVWFWDFGCEHATKTFSVVYDSNLLLLLIC